MLFRSIPLSQDQEDIGREIAKRCQGIPLVARVLGGTMSNKIGKFMVCLVTVFFSLFSVSKNNFLFLRQKKLVWQLKMDRKQKLFSKLNL